MRGLIDTTPHRHEAVRLELLAAAEAALAAVRPEEAIARAVVREGATLRLGEHRVALGDHDRALVLGFGKAAVPMGRAALRLLDGLPVEGVLVSTAPEPVDGLEVVAGSHPAPDERSVEGGRRILHAARGAGPRDLAVVLVSGGGSSAIAVPADGLALDDLRATNELLLRSGAAIGELNTVRKHLSAVAGGWLGEALAGAGTIVTLVLSDVVGDPLDVIASGPTVPDPTTFADALAVLDRHGLRQAVPPAVREHLEAGRAGIVPETPKSGPAFERQLAVVVAGGAVAALAAAEAADRARVVTAELEGEAREVARELVGAAGAPGETLVYAGETTVTVTGDGSGGRNQELALAASLELAGRDDVVVLALGTDGLDGTTESAGAFADGTAVARGHELGLDAAGHLARNDSHAFLAAIGDTVDSGPTGTNVGDLVLVRRTR